MIKSSHFLAFSWLIILAFCLPVLVLPSQVEGYTQSESKKFQSRMVDYRSRLNPSFKRVKRQKTDYIIVHTSELGLEATLRVLSQGKQSQGRYKTPGGHAHYVVARNGQVYQILEDKYRADHAGLSMWNGQADISRVSVGIELVGYHHSPITENQYHSLARLLRTLKKNYGLKDMDVLTHSQIAYGRPNPWFPKDHRGRKRCAKNFDRAKAGLGPGWRYDPDVRTGRLMPDPLLVAEFYGPRPAVKRVEAPRIRVEDSTRISKTNTAWSIAGDEYNSRSTAYIFPDGRAFFGDQIEGKIGWDRVPVNTRVLLNQESSTATVQKHSQSRPQDQGRQDQTLTQDLGPVKVISDTMTAWSHAGPAYRQASTIYFLPSGRVNSGSVISDWDDLPAKTRLIVGYTGPFPITRERTAFKIAGHSYKNPDIIYYLPSQELISGDQMTDFGNLPQGAQVFLPLSKK